MRLNSRILLDPGEILRVYATSHIRRQCFRSFSRISQTVRVFVVGTLLERIKIAAASYVGRLSELHFVVGITSYVPFLRKISDDLFVLI